MDCQAPFGTEPEIWIQGQDLWHCWQITLPWIEPGLDIDPGKIKIWPRVEIFSSGPRLLAGIERFSGGEVGVGGRLY